jgi:uncharacterized coiled-coil protein SlyX
MAKKNEAKSELQDVETRIEEVESSSFVRSKMIEEIGELITQRWSFPETDIVDHPAWDHLERLRDRILQELGSKAQELYVLRRRRLVLLEKVA